MSDVGSALKTLWNLAMVGFVLLAVVLGVIVVIFKANEEEGGESTEHEEGEGLHPDGDMLILKFREMFDYDVEAPVNDGRGSSGITPIVVNEERKDPINLAEFLALTEKTERSISYLADGTTRVEQAVGWFVHKGKLHYVLLLRPFERVAHEMMRQTGEDLFISFLDADGERVVPHSAPEPIATKDMRVAVTQAKRMPAGWVTYGELPLDGASGEGIVGPKVGWVLSGRLHARLRQLQRTHILRDEGVRDPFNLDLEAKSKVGE